MRIRHTSRLVALGVCLAVLLTGCATDESDLAPGDQARNPFSPELSGTLRVYAAASLQGAMSELLDQFGLNNEHLRVAEPVIDGSSTLATQIREGAPGDVFASADEATMATVTKNLAGAPTVFATNTLEIAVQPGNPKHITGLSSLAAPGLQVVTCARAVPCGAAAHTLVSLDGIDLTPVSEEQNVTAVLTKVKLGEADAGIVYRTDIAAAKGAVDGVGIEGSERATNRYPIAVLDASQNPRAAKAFVAFVLSDAGQAILAKYGFGAP